jgi:hypothetical protein
MFRRWFCLTLALVLGLGSFALAEELAIEDGAGIADVSENTLLLDPLPDGIQIALPEDLELSLSNTDVELEPLSGEPEGLDAVEAVNDADQAEARLELSASKLLMGIGEKCTLLKATRIPEDGSDAVTWSSSKSSIASVKGGRITGHKAGTCTVTARLSGGKTLTCKVTVVNPAALSKTQLTLKVGGTYKLKVSGLGRNTVSWSSNFKSVATVDKNGTVTAVNPGRCTITAKLGNGTVLKCRVTVKK